MQNRKVIYAPMFVSVIMILLLISENIIRTSVNNGTDYYLSLSVVQMIVYMLPLAFYCKVRGIIFFKTLKFNLFSYRNLFLTLCIIIMFIVGMLLFLFADLYYFEGSIYAANVKPYVFTGTGEKIYAVLGLIVIPAFVKELLFRGVILNEYRTKGAFWSVLMSTILFALASMSFDDFPKFLYVGIFFGIVGLVVGNVVPSIIMHIIFNFFVVYAESTVVNYMKKISDSAMPLFILGLLLLISMFFTFAFLESIYRKKSEECQEENNVIKKLSALERTNEKNKTTVNKKKFSQNAAELLLSPAFLVTVVIFVIAAVLERM